MGMITFNVSENLAFDRMYNHYWFDADFIEQTPHLTTGIVDTWMNYALENYGIRPLDDGIGTWAVVDEQKIRTDATKMDIKILSHRSPGDRSMMMFTNVIRFQPQTDDDKSDYPYENSLNRICSWISLNFKENFVVLEKTSHRIAGGWADNKKGWKVQKYKVDRREHSSTAVYELRCMGSDATLFMLKWG